MLFLRKTFNADALMTNHFEMKYEEGSTGQNEAHNFRVICLKSLCTKKTRNKPNI